MTEEGRTAGKPTSKADLDACTIGGARPHGGPIHLAECDPRWPELFEREAARIERALGDTAMRVEHVGSTSVPGLAAKPVIDILLEVPDSGDESAYVAPLESHGYELRIREPDWWEHRMLKGPDTDVNLHVFTAGCPEIGRMLRFRDHLRASPSARRLYELRKRELASREWDYVQHYADAKTRVIEDILARADAGARAYLDGRPRALLRLEAVDQGIVLRHGDGPAGCDALGVRDVWAWESDGLFHMHYDGAGADGWLACLATSEDLVRWEKHGPVLDFGPPGGDDSGTAAYGVTCFDAGRWHMFYVGTPNVSPDPDRVPAFPYLTLKAEADSPRGPWRKLYELAPFRTLAGTYYSCTASPGQVVRSGEEWLMFFSAAALEEGRTRRTLSIARAPDLDGPWRVDPRPMLPPDEQIENSSLYYESANRTWFLFTNHVGVDERDEYTDAVWVYWSKDLESWSGERKAVVLDWRNCTWSSDCIGLPSVLRRGNRLAILYDAPGGTSISHMRRHVGLAWLDLPLEPPSPE